LIRLHLVSGTFGEGRIVRQQVEWRGQSAAELVLDHSLEEWGPDVPLWVGVGGALVTGEDLDKGVPDDSDVVLAPAVGYGLGAILVQAIIVAIVSLAINYIIQLIWPPPKPPGVPQQRGDRSSQTYAWGGLETNYGQGFPVAIGYGEHTLGCQVISTSVFAGAAFPGTVRYEQVSLIAALCEGRIESIGGVTGGSKGEADGLYVGNPMGGFPTGIKVNEVLIEGLEATFASAWLRMGEVAQSELPPPWVGSATTFLINLQLKGLVPTHKERFAVTSAQQMAKVTFVVAWPSGIYGTSSNGTIVAANVSFWPQWGPPGFSKEPLNSYFYDEFGNQINSVNPIRVGTAAPIIGYYSSSFDFYFPPGQIVTGPIDVKINYDGAGGPAGGSPIASTDALWRQVIVHYPLTFSYPRTALVALSFRAGPSISGALPRLQIPAKLKRVRVWDPLHGWSPETWEVPPAPWNFHEFPPGHNPAWVLLDFLLSRPGLGRWTTEEQIDLQAFREWSIYCDSRPGPGGSTWAEPRYRFDGVMDASRPAWEWVLAICRAGGAAPVKAGNKISVFYQYRDAHADAGEGGYMQIPARTPTQLFNDANTSNVQVDYVNRSGRPTVLDFQYLDGTKGYVQDVYPVDETESYLSHLAETPPLRNRGFRREAIQAWGVTRPSQLYRMGIRMHRLNRLVRKRLTFRTGIWALAACPGTLIRYQHDLIRPYDPEIGIGMVVAVGGVKVSQITVDRSLTASGGTDKIVIRVPATAPSTGVEERTVSAISGAESNVLTLDAPVTVNPGAPCSFGQADKITETYQCVTLTLDKQGLRDVLAISWDPDVYDEPEDGAGGSTEQSYAPGPDVADVANDKAAITVDADDVRLFASPTRPGHWLISWPAGARDTGDYLVYIRPAGGTSWWRVGASTGADTTLEVAGLGAWGSWEIAIAARNARGDMQSPYALEYATLTAEEFPPFAPPGVEELTAQQVEEIGWRLRWNPIEAVGFRYFEVREGTFWAGGKVLYRGREPEFTHRDPSPDLDRYMVRMRATSGLYSRATAHLDDPGEWNPGGTIDGVSDLVEVPPTLSLPTELEYDAGDGAIQVKDGYVIGEYETDELDLGFEARAWWAVSWNHEEYDNATVDDLDFPVQSGEALWRTIHAREASPSRPGVNWDGPTVDELDMSIDDLPTNLTVAGWHGEPGAHTLCRIESRYYVGGAWTAYATHRNGWRVAEKLQVRLTLGRDSLQGQSQCNRLSLHVRI